MPKTDRPTRKLIEFDPDSWQALTLLSRDSMKSLQELMDEAVLDLLKKHGRPTSLNEMLRASTRAVSADDAVPKARESRRRRR